MDKVLTPRESFLRATYMLAKSSPMAWHNFVAEMDNYVRAEIERGIAAPSSELMLLTGMSRRLIELRDDFHNIEAVGKKLELVA